MKTKLNVLIFLLAATLVHAQTNNLTTLLQKGLFEEQANRNLDAAIADYQTLATQFDQDRKLAATAIFRLGECYRMQGKTNEAVVQYQRIIREFPDEKTLVALSRQNLALLGVASSTTTSSDNSGAQLWNRVKNLPQDQLEEVLPTLAPDPMLTSLLQQRNEAETKLAKLQTEFGPTSVYARAQKAALAAINKQISEKISGIMQALKLRAELAQTTVRNATPPNPEDKEIQRIQQMIQNSPDLINAPIPGDSTRTPLIRAAFLGWLKVAAYLLDHGAEINMAASDVVANGELAEAGRVSPLLAAVAAGNKSMTQFLIDRGADVNFHDDKGDTPLHLAAELGFQAVTEALLASHADVNARDNSGNTPLDLAVEKGRNQIVHTLLVAGANPNLENNQGRTPLSFAAENGSPKLVKMLLAAKANPNGGKLDAPLLCAIHKNDVTSAELLLRAGANPNVKGKVDWGIQIGNRIYERRAESAQLTPLWLAISMNQFPMVQLLLKFKADPNDTQTDGHPLLFDALSDTNILEALLDAGAKVDALPEYSRSVSRTPLDAAIIGKHVTTVEILLKHGANPNASNSTSVTPLHFAAWSLASPRIFELLLDSHANPNVRDNQGQTPLDILKEKSTSNSPPAQKTLARELADLLLAHGALEHLPHWNRIEISRPGSDYFATVFRESTNNWNHFTLLETILSYYENNAMSRTYAIYGGKPGGTRYPINPGIPFPNLANVIIVRPSRDSTNVIRTKIDLLNGTNGIDCSKDVPLKFGDVVEIPEREHTLAESDTNGPAWVAQISDCLRKRAGAVKLIVEGGQAVEVQLDQFGPLDCGIGEVLGCSQAQNVLTSDSDFSRVKVIRRDIKTGKTNEWILNCSNYMSWVSVHSIPNTYAERIQLIVNKAASQFSPDLWLRNGDVIEVPEK